MSVRAIRQRKKLFKEIKCPLEQLQLSKEVVWRFSYHIIYKLSTLYLFLEFTGSVTRPAARGRRSRFTLS